MNMIKMTLNTFKSSHYLCLVLLLFFSLLSAVQIPQANMKRGTARFYDNGQINYVRLTTPYEMENYLCTNWVKFDRLDKLVSFDTAKEIRMGNDKIPRMSHIILYDTGEIQTIKLDRATMIQGLYCIGYGAESPPVSFWKNGNLKLASLRTASEIYGLLAKPGTFSPVSFFEDGKLQSLTLLNSQQIEGRFCKAGTVINFDPDGKLAKSTRLNWFKRTSIALMDIVL